MVAVKPIKGVSKKCPNCAKSAVLQFRPFCSAHCSQIDLSNWLNEDYRIPVLGIENFDEENLFEEDD